MNQVELERKLRTLRLSGMVASLDSRLLHAQSEPLSHFDFLAHLVTDELDRRSDRLIARRIKDAKFRDADKTLDAFDFDFNRKMNKKQIFDLATCNFIDRREDALFLGPPGSGKSHVAQALGLAAITQGYRVRYRETYHLLEELADASLAGERKNYLANLLRYPLLIIDDFAMRKLPTNAAEELLEVIMRRYERASTIITSNRPVEDWGQLLGDTAGATAILDRLLHHGHVLKFGPRSYRMPRRTQSA